MSEIHYLISDASKKVDVEAHVLRYWEDELKLDIPRNEMGHRYYTELHIRLFRQVKVLKEKGYQLKAIKSALDRVMEAGEDLIVSDEVLEEDMEKALKECAAVSEAEKEKTAEEAENSQGAAGENAELAAVSRADSVAVVMTAEEKMEQFQEIMNHIIGRALEANNEKLSQDISHMVNTKVTKEMEYMFRLSDEKGEERFKQLDEIIRSCQKDSRGRAEAAAAKIPFFKKKRFGKKNK